MRKQLILLLLGILAVLSIVFFLGYKSLFSPDQLSIEVVPIEEGQLAAEIYLLNNELFTDGQGRDIQLTRTFAGNCISCWDFEFMFQSDFGPQTVIIQTEAGRAVSLK